jgi:hypothetical protein
MKIVIRRHAREFAIFRVGAIAQALAQAGHQVFIECLETHRRAVSMLAKVEWKNPHHPFEVAERVAEKPEHLRKGGKLYDHVLELDGDGPFEARWQHLGIPFWTWSKGEVRRLGLPDIPFIPDWPEIKTLPASDLAGAPPYILVSVLSEEAMPDGVNVNALEELISARHPGAKVLWTAFQPFNFGEGRETWLSESYTALALQIAGAQAVYAVNGMVRALASSFVGDKPLARRLCYIEAAPEGAKPRKFTVLDRASGQLQEKIAPPGKPDPFARIRQLFAAPPNPAQGGILTFDAALALTERQPTPD